MRNDIGIFNSRSITNEYIRDLKSASISLPPRMTVTRWDLDALSIQVGAQHRLAVHHGSAVRVRELIAQLALIEMAKAGI